mmetsp:Transcript_19782/g.32053  ORF Transcript_19782/g.32053 Transcript_19782/m.32053 type:complete len:103 (-) Transcript_19782:12-320(-)
MVYTHDFAPPVDSNYPTQEGKLRAARTARCDVVAEFNSLGCHADKVFAVLAIDTKKLPWSPIVKERVKGMKKRERGGDLAFPIRRVVQNTCKGRRKTERLND